VRWYPRDYYLAALAVPAFAALLAVRRLWWLLCVAAAVQGWQAAHLPRETLAGQEEMAMAGWFVRAVAEVGATNRVGSFNSGLLAWYSRGGPLHESDAAAAPPARNDVVNLDGVVDHRAFAALRAHRLDAWLDEQQVVFLLDNPLQFERRPGVLHACGPWFGPGFDAARDLVEVARFDVPGLGEPGYDSFRLYWRRGRGAMPARRTEARDLGDAADGGVYVLWPARAGQALEVEREGGVREVLVEAPIDTQWVLKLARERLGSGRLFVRGQGEPILRLRSR
jgi:hypothetical protein